MDSFATGGQAAVVGYHNEGIDFCRPCDQSSNTSNFATWTFTFATPGKSTLCCQEHKCCLVTAPSPLYSPLERGAAEKPLSKKCLAKCLCQCITQAARFFHCNNKDNSRDWSLGWELTKDLSFVTLVLFIQVGSAVLTLLAVRWMHDIEITCCVQ